MLNSFLFSSLSHPSLLTSRNDRSLLGIRSAHIAAARNALRRMQDFAIDDDSTDCSCITILDLRQGILCRSTVLRARDQNVRGHTNFYETGGQTVRERRSYG